MGDQFADRRDNVSECRSCGAEVVWTLTSKGKRMPCDLLPVEGGDFFLFRVGDNIDAVHAKSRDERASKAERRGQDRFASHFATCPNAAQHRGGGKRDVRWKSGG